MSNEMDVYCSTCFALPGEMCRTKYLIHGKDEVTPVICRSHSARLVESQRELTRRSFANRLLAVVMTALRGD